MRRSNFRKNLVPNSDTPAFTCDRDGLYRLGHCSADVARWERKDSSLTRGVKTTTTDFNAWFCLLNYVSSVNREYRVSFR